MTTMIIAISLFVFLLIIILFSGEYRKDAYKRSQIKHMNEEIGYVDEELEKSFVQRFITPYFKKISIEFSKMATKSQKKSARKKTTNVALETMLRQAGISISIHEYQLLKMMLIAVFMAVGIVGAFLVTDDIAILALLMMAYLMAVVAVPRFILKSKIKSRGLAIQNDMPNVMDVLSVSIEAGLGFDAALLKVIDKLSGPLIDEFLQVYREIQMGRSRKDALTALAKRNEVDEIQMFVSAIVQSEQFGTPIKNVLRGQSEQLRISRRQQAQEKGMKAPVKMMVPMVLFIFPVIFIILLGPTVINVIGQFN